MKLSVDERNARTSARQVRAFLSGRVRHDVGYLSENVTTGKFFVSTWTGELLLRLDKVTKTQNRGAFGAYVSRMNAGVTTWRAPEIIYFSGKDARGRRWHGVSPGVGMFARLHLNKGRKARPRPASRAALRRALTELARAVRLFRAGDPSAHMTMYTLADRWRHVK